MENAYIEYYTVQLGAGIKDIGPLYHNYRFVQQGNGFGSLFGAFYRFLKPMLNTGIKTLRNQAIKTGVSVLSELGSKPFNEIITEHGKKAVQELHSKYKSKFQAGSGLVVSGVADKKPIKAIGKINKRIKKKSIKRIQNKKQHQSKSKRGKKQTSKKRNKKPRILDIFS